MLGYLLVINEWSLDVNDYGTQMGIGVGTMTALALLPTFLTLKFALEYFKYSLGAVNGNEPGVMWDWQEIARVLVISTLIISFLPLAVGITNAIDTINDATKGGDETKAQLKEMNVKFMEIRKNAFTKEEIKKLNAVQELNASETKYVVDKIESEWDIKMNENGQAMSDEELLRYRATLKSIKEGDGMMASANAGYDFWDFRKILVEIALYVASWIKSAMSTFIIVAFKIALTFGPLVLVFGVFKPQLIGKYFTMILSLGLVFTTMNIFDQIIAGFMIDNVDTGDVSDAVVMACVIIAGYFNSFKITNWFVGASDANGMVNRSFGVAVGATALAIGGMGSGGQAAAAVASKTNTRVD